MYIDIFKWRKEKLEEFRSFDQDLLTEGEERLPAKNQEVGLNWKTDKAEIDSEVWRHK